jgi:hypothetical protein
MWKIECEVGFLFESFAPCQGKTLDTCVEFCHKFLNDGKGGK